MAFTLIEQATNRWIAFAIGIACALGAAYCEAFGFAFLIIAYTTREHLT